MTTTHDLDEMVRHEIQVMAAAGWRLYQRHADGADFTSGSSGSGISGGVHLILLVITAGLWFPIMVLVELLSPGGVKFYRLTFDDLGQPRYEKIRKPR